VHFSEQFNVSAIKMRALGVFNPEIGIDSKMFVDPKLLHDAKDEFAGSHADLLNHFGKVVKIIKRIKNNSDSDMAWVAAWTMMRFKETSNTSLGFSEDGTKGTGIGKVLAQRIVSRATEILPHVNYEPDIFELIGVFAEGLGCDRLSDMIVSILKPRFVAYTDRITRALGVKRVIAYEIEKKEYLFPCFKEGDEPILLLPQEILKPLPIAMNIGEALDNADLNERVRDEVNKMYSDAFTLGATPSKNQLRSFIWSRK